MAKKKPTKKTGATAAPLKLDLGCGPNKAGPDWTGVDSRVFKGVDQVVDLVKRRTTYTAGHPTPPFGSAGYTTAAAFLPWPWADNSVDEVRASHFVEHLKRDERVHFVNELHRVLKPGAKAQIITPHWASTRAYGDLTHEWPPVSEFWFYYLSKAWRDTNAPHNDAYTCDLVATWGHGLHPELGSRNDEYKQFAVTWYKEAATDLIATFQKPPA